VTVVEPTVKLLPLPQPVQVPITVKFVTTGLAVYVGAAVDPVAFPKTVWLAAVAKVAVTVPEVVTAGEGVELSTVPSPVNVTLVTVPDPPPPPPPPLRIAA
jgi:hypothetical protein